MHFVGKLENISEDGLVFVRFDNILIDFETDGIAFPENSIIKVSVEEFILCEIKY